MPTVQFSVLSYYPSFVTQENINIGILFYNADSDEPSFYFIKKWDRVKAFDDELNINFMKEYLKGLSHELNKNLFNYNNKFDLRQLVKYYVNEYKFSRVQTVICEDSGAFIENTKKMYLKFDYEKHERLNKKQEKKYIYQLLRSSGIAYTKQKIKGAFQEDIKYDYIIGDHAVKLFSFEGKALQYLVSSAKAWAFNAEEMQNMYKTIFIYDVELKDAPLYNSIIEILNRSAHKTMPLSDGIDYLLSLGKVDDSNAPNKTVNNQFT